MAENRSIIFRILEELNNTTLNYKGMRVNIFGLPTFNKFNKNSLKSTVWKLKNGGYINPLDFRLTKKGKRYLHKKYNSLKQFYFSPEADAKKDMIVMFDIPEHKRPEREWFRWHLKKLNYEMVQRSVWIGPSPLPEEFMSYLKKIKIKEFIKIFKLSKSYRENKSKQNLL